MQTLRCLWAGALAAAGVCAEAGTVEPKAWATAATAAQVPGASAFGDGRTVAAALWFNAHSDVGTLQFSQQGMAGVTGVAIRCGVAGHEGPTVWTAVGPTFVSGQSLSILQRNLSATGGASGCPMAIGNLAALKAAAEQRFLYLELTRSGPTLRGQLWPTSLGLQHSAVDGVGFTSTAGASDQQAVPAATGTLWRRALVSLWFSEYGNTLDRVEYTVPFRHRYRSVSLHCAAAGQEGAVVALLTMERGSLSNADIVPTVDGPCGLTVNNTASLFEALLRGNLYVSLEALEPVGLELRGQFEAP